jgi:hypothetical protein
MGYYILYSKDSKLCVEAEVDIILAELALERIEGLVYAKRDPFTAGNAVREI